MTKATGKTALLSVADRTGIVEFAQGLHELGYRLLSAGATLQTLRQAEISCDDVRELTRQPDVLGGRLRLIHPSIFSGALVDRSAPEQVEELKAGGFPPIDLVAVNLYPLASILHSGEPSQKEVMDFLDVSASALLRAAARNFHHVIPVCDPRDYPSVLDALRQGKGLKLDRCRALAAKAFNYISYYDATVAQYLGAASTEKLPDELILSLKKTADLRYGENPHQAAALYSRSGARPWGMNVAELLYGKPLSYNHYLSMDRAVELAGEFAQPACAIVKHCNPAGVAYADRLGEAARLAYRSDPEGCTGGVAAFNREVDGEAAALLASEYLQCIVAPDFTGNALDVLRAKKDVRLVRLPSLLLSPNEVDIQAVSGGILIQDKDNPVEPPKFRSVTKRSPSELESAAMDFAWRVCKHATTHAAVLARGTSTLGIAGGQTSRMDAVRLALVKSQERHPIVSPSEPMALASDGPLSPRHVKEAAEAGVAAVIQSGGSSEDGEAVEQADELGLAMVFTGVRHYRH